MYVIEEHTEGDLKDEINKIGEVITSIKNSSTSNKISDVIINVHYLCPNCHSFPLIIFKKNKKLIIKCEDCEEGTEFTIDNYMKYKITKDELQDFKKCKQNEKYIGYCFGCLLFFCENNSKGHEGHNIKNFNDIINFIKKRLKIPDIVQVKGGTNLEVHNVTSEKNEMGGTIKFEEKNGELFQKKNNDNIDSQYSNDPFEDLIKMIINDEKNYDNNTHYKNIKNYFYYLCDQMEIEYHNFENKKLEFRIFGKNFVENNKNNFILFIDGKEEKLKETYKVKEENTKLNIKLIKINEPTDLSEMFYECDCLSKIKKINKWETSNVESITGMFKGCKALVELPDISEFVTDKITDLSSIFEGCEILENIPGISNWDVNNVNHLENLFNGCHLLEKLDLSEWKPSKLVSMESMFQYCYNLNNLEGLENFDTSQVTNMSKVFYKCEDLNEIKGISDWNTQKVESFSDMFYFCNSLKKLPDLSKWKTQNAKFINYMFSNCHELEEIPDISNWNVEKVTEMNSMFEKCSSLKSFPDISKWKINPKADTSYMFKGCRKLKGEPLLNI